MAKHHLHLTKEEFDDLRKMKMVPLAELPVSDGERARLLKGAKEKHGPHTEMVWVVCGMVDDSVVCHVVKTGKDR